MHFKLIVAVVEDADTEAIVNAARAAGATGSTVLNQAWGEGYAKERRRFLGLDVGGERDLILMLVEEHLARRILERVGAVGKFDTESGAGLAFQIDVEDAIGVLHQQSLLHPRVEEEL